MRTLKQDPLILEANNPREAAAIVRRGWLARIFNPVFDAAIISSYQNLTTDESISALIPFLERILDTGDDKTERVIHANVRNREFSPHDVFLTEQLKDRQAAGRRVVKFHGPLFGKPDMYPGFGTIMEIFSNFARYNEPVMGRNVYVSILDKSGVISEEDDKHRDIEMNQMQDQTIDGNVFCVANMPLQKHHPATVLFDKDGNKIRPENGSPVYIKGNRPHASPSCSEFRPIICARPAIM